MPQIPLLAAGLAFVALFVSVASPKSLRPFCGGQRATIASDEHRIRGTRGPDVIVAGRGPDVILGGGSDLICGGLGRDRLFGEQGNDTLRGGPGSRDEVDGGPGDDTVEGGRGGAIEVDLGHGLVLGAEHEWLIGIEDVLGGSGEDTLAGSASAAGDDVLFGVNILHPRHRSGRTALSGGAGDDLLIGGQPCADRFHGGGGDNDSVSFARVRNAGSSSGR